MAVVTLNIWTGAPLLGLWVGSQVAPDSGISMGAVFVAILVIGVAVWALIQLLYRLQAAYARASGQPLARRQTTWLKPMSGERTHGKGAVAKPLSSVDYVVIACVVLAVAAFEIWFFFFAGSPIG
jgi:Tfp pilus assembly protein PilV